MPWAKLDGPAISPVTRYEDLTTEEVPAGLAAGPLILPLGSIEQHGPHLPLSVDLDIALAVAAALAQRVGGLLAPAVCYTARSLPASGGGSTFPGTIHVKGQVLLPYLSAVFGAYLSAGVRDLIVINGHYESEALIFEALDSSREDGVIGGARVLALSWWSVVEESLVRELFGNSYVGWHAEHAGLCETSLMLYLRPDAVRPIRVDHATPPPCGVYSYPLDPGRVSTRGVLSATTNSSSDAGKQIFEHICLRLSKLLEGLPNHRELPGGNVD